MRFLHVGVYLNNVTPAQIEKVLDDSHDWLRYGGNSWIVYTDKDEKWWTRKLDPLFTSGRIIIFPIDPKQKWGRAEQWIWDWLEKPR